MPFSIERMLSDYALHTRLRLHMPGHGGALDAADVTELPMTDALLSPAGAILESERAAAELFFSKLTLFFCGGATLALQTAIAAQLCCIGAGARVVCERRVHRSVPHALALLGVEPRFVEREEISAAVLEEADLLIVSGCDYFGRIPDYERLSALCRRQRVRSVVDNAHGTHLAFWKGGGLHPLSFGFDCVVDSAHKTLPALTGAALLHIGKGFAGDAEALYRELKHFTALFSTTSPSFVILQSLSAALKRISSEFDGYTTQSLEIQAARLDAVRAAVGAPLAAPPRSDPFRLVLRGAFDFAALYERLRERGIVCECYTEDALLMLPAWDFSRQDARLLTEALTELLPQVRRAARALPPFPVPERCMSLKDALFSAGEYLPANRAGGRIAGEVCGACPPGLCVVMPGERIDEKAILHLGGGLVRVVKEEGATP